MSLLRKFGWEILMLALIAGISAIVIKDLTRDPLPGIVYEVRDTVVKVEFTAEVEVVERSMGEDGKVRVVKSTEASRGSGSGVFVSKDGHILTCAHLFSDGRLLELSVITRTGNRIPAQLLNADENADLALLKISSATPRCSRAPLGSLEVGERVVVLGHPYGHMGDIQTVTHGIISSLPTFPRFRTPRNGTDAAINPGNSGGPVFDMHGRLVGVAEGHFFHMLPVFSGLGFMVRIEEIEEYLSKFRGI